MTIRIQACLTSAAFRVGAVLVIVFGTIATIVCGSMSQINNVLPQTALPNADGQYPHSANDTPHIPKKTERAPNSGIVEAILVGGQQEQAPTIRPRKTSITELPKVDSPLDDGRNVEMVDISIPSGRLIVTIVRQPTGSSVRHGTFRKYDRKGALREEGEYSNDLLTGLWRAWDDKGFVCEEACYKDGQRHGWTKVWFESGVIQSEVNYIEGDRDGIYQEWHQNTSIAIVGAYRRGNHVGVWRYFDESRRLTAEVDCDQ